MTIHDLTRVALIVGVAVVAALAPSLAQQPGELVLEDPPGTATVAPTGEGVPLLPPDLQIVRFHGPAGVSVEVLNPAPEPVPIGEEDGLATFGLRVGQAYQLRVSNLPDRPDQALFPVIEVVGHLHRPPGIDPSKYPIRIKLTPQDFDDVLDHGRLVTQVVYLEDPDQAIPISMPKNDVPVVPLGPSEEPLRVAAALGRVMAIVRLGGRAPLPDDPPPAPVVGLTGGPCPFAGPEGGRCPLPCGPVRGTAPPAGRPWMPRDEFLCDGGDHGQPANFGDGGLRGIDPRDAVIQFHTGRRPRVLPTNMVCIYAPRFAAVRTGIGPNANLSVTILDGHVSLQRQAAEATRQETKRLAQNLRLSSGRGRARSSGMNGRTGTIAYQELRILGSAEVLQTLDDRELVQGPQGTQTRQKADMRLNELFAQGIEVREGVVVSGILESAGEQVTSWKPLELKAVEEMPARPGMVVIKRVSTNEAQPGDVVTYVIQFRNMGNVPIDSVSVLDSLLPRLEYVKGSAKGPKGSVFTAAENRVGAMELQWDIGTIAPGAEGYVSFEAKVR